ncbi:FadR/GntR family transcriptional regulator [Streptomyces sp. NBC_01431]|uniref:FadR/GntR family transcriptional regulator n=1 Tax=Streptomyces sp. NBC_01431 TaxID=2903863 RepID=UPI002E32AA0D|nr:FadR/GntR family transcriptional regulator [Streptomyces sp. NBC_01431]
MTGTVRGPAGGSAEEAPYRPGYEVAAEQLLELIASMDLRPGDRLPTELELAGRLGTSRTVVREGVKILSALGRVRAQKGRGLYVADDPGMLGSGRFGGFFLPTNLDHLFMLFEFRRVQETEASRLASVRATPVELRAIEKAADTCRRAFESGDVELFEQGDDAFHTGIAAAAHNAFLSVAVQEARRLQSQSGVIALRGTLGGHGAAAIEEHDAIFHAIKDGRPEDAVLAAATHIDNTLEDYRKRIQQRVFG